MTKSGPLILIPPSEGKASGGSEPAWQPAAGAWPELAHRRIAVAKALRTAMKKPVASRTKLLGVKGDALADATAVNLAVFDGPTLPAQLRYTGVLYDELDPSSLPAPARRYFDEQVVIFSGLLGMVRPNDLIPDYKLKMGSAIGRPGKLSTWWRVPVTEALAPEVADRTVWDLLPNEHRAAWAPSRIGMPDGPSAIVSVRFLDGHEPPRRGRPGDLVAVNHWNKLLKGSLVRHLVTTQLTDVDGLAEFTHPRGYRYRPDLTATDGDRTVVSLVRPFAGAALFVDP